MVFYFNFSNHSSTKENIKEHIEQQLNSISYDEEANFKNLILKAEEEIKENNIIEYSFTYLKRHPYIDETEQPNAIYELEECFIWVSTQDNFIAIKNSPNKIIQILKQVFSNIYGTMLNNIKLNNTLVEEIFGNDRRKATAINVNPNNERAEKITISDRNFKEKGLDKELEGYDITGDNLNISVDDVAHVLGLKRDKGKLYLTKNMTARNFRTWSTQTIKKIVDYLTENEGDFDAFCSKNILSSDRWKKYDSQIKKVIEEICYKIYIFEKKDKEESILNTVNIREYTKMKKYFYSTDLIECPVCNEIVYPTCECNGNVIKIQEKFYCKDCEKEIKQVICEEGHSIGINEENIVTYYYPMEELLHDIKISLKETFNINFEGGFTVNNENNLSIIKEIQGNIIDIATIDEFTEISKIQLKEEKRQNLLLELKEIKEKCKISNCKDCNPTTNTNCLMKIFTTYNGYRPSPHQGHEFGDITFQVTHNKQRQQFVGIAKSHVKNKTGNLTIATSAAEEMIRQILCATYDKRIDIIGAICPNRFDDQLRQTIRYISQITKTKICIFDDEIMTKQLQYYKSKFNIENERPEN